MRILFTGASSFTGMHFVQALAAAGHQLICPLRRPVEQYQGLRRKRIEQLISLSSSDGERAGVRGTFFPAASFGSDAFLDLFRDHAPLDLLCHHAADVTNYKSPDFDPLRALENNTFNIRKVLDIFKRSGGKAVLLTGTIFEMDEGSSSPPFPIGLGEGLGVREPLPAFSPYGLSKGLTWQIFRYFCAEAGLPLGKFVIPNPFGPCEEPRFTAYLMNSWREGKTAKVQTPDYIRDNIHVDLLAAAYSKFASQIVAITTPVSKLNPSGYIEPQGEFAQRVAREVQARTDWLCNLELMPQKEFPEPKIRINTQPAAQLCPQWNEAASWEAFVNFYQSAPRNSTPKTP